MTGTMEWTRTPAEDFGVDFMGTTDFAIQYKGNDLVHVTDLDRASNTVRIRVFAGPEATAPILFEGVVSLGETAATREETKGDVDG